MMPQQKRATNLAIEIASQAETGKECLTKCWYDSLITNTHNDAGLSNPANDKTVEILATPNVTIFDYGIKLEDEGNYYVSMSIGKNNTCYNAVTEGETRLAYFEYSPMFSAKFERNTLKYNSFKSAS